MGTHKKTTRLPAQHPVHSVHTLKGEQTKRKLIRVAADLALRQGFRRTSLDEILSEAAIPKGSLYFYFKNKAALGRAVIQYRRETLLEALREIFQNSDATLKDQIKDWFAFMLSTQETSAGPLGCPLGNLAQELSREDKTLPKRWIFSLPKPTRFCHNDSPKCKKKAHLYHDLPRVILHIFSSWRPRERCSWCECATALSRCSKRERLCSRFWRVSRPSNRWHVFNSVPVDSPEYPPAPGGWYNPRLHRPA